MSFQKIYHTNALDLMMLEQSSTPSYWKFFSLGFPLWSKVDIPFFYSVLILTKIKTEYSKIITLLDGGKILSLDSTGTLRILQCTVGL